MSGFKTYDHPGLQPFAPGIYNLRPSTAPNLTQAVKGLKAGSLSPIIDFQGDSTFFGEWAGGAQWTDAHSNSAWKQLATLLNTAGIPASADNIFGDGASPLSTFATAEPLFSVTGAGWVGGGFGAPGGPDLQNTSHAGINDTTGFISLGADHSCDSADVFFLKQTTSDQYAWGVDGGAFSSGIVAPGPALSLQKVTLALGSSATHSIQINAPTAQCLVQGISLWDSATPRVLLRNQGWPGSQSSSWATTTNAWDCGNSFASFGAHMIVSQIGLVNDRNGSINSARILTTHANRCVRARAAGADYVIFNSHPTSNDQFCQSFRNDLRALATQLQCALIDVMDLYPTGTLWNAGGFNGDGGLHPSGTGYGVYASLFSTMLQAVYGWS